MATGLLLDLLTECKSELESLRDQTAKSVTQHDEYWTKGVVFDLNADLARVSSLLCTLNNETDRQYPDNVISQAQDVCGTIKQATLQYEERGLPELERKLSPDERDQVKTKLAEPSLKYITKHVDILVGLAEIAQQNLSKRDIERKLASYEIRDFREVYESLIRSIDPALRRASFSPLRTGGIQFGDPTLAWFWNSIICHKRLYKGRTDTADGILIRAEHIEKTRQRLESFRRAWLTVNNTYDLRPSDESVLTDFVGMAKIICVLRGCSKHDHLNTFLRLNITDKSLEDEDLLDRMSQVMASEDADFIFGEFSRVRRRPWEKHSHLVLGKHEPIPLIRGRELRGSSVSSTGVYEASDAWETEINYAHKIILRDDYEETRRQRLVNEIAKLGAISREKHGHHIVECVKTYQRGANELGMLLRPVANTDLADLLNRCSRNARARQDNRTHLIKACGCLTYAMCYLHNVQDIRHYDVKPGNVLVYSAAAGDDPVFLWADFGLAFGFKRTGFSGSANENYAATAAYEPPDTEFHSRAHDVYGLGCIFLEIVSVLSMGNRVAERPPVHQFRNYKEKLPQLQQWTVNQLKVLRDNHDKTLRGLLQLAQDMLFRNREERPKIHQVMERLRKIDMDKSSGMQPFCRSCAAGIQADLSNSTFRHPKIFTHKSSGRSASSLSWLTRLHLNHTGP